MTKEQRLKVVQGMLSIMEVSSESIANKSKIMRLFNDLMIKNVNIKELQQVVFKFVEGEK